VHGAAPIVQLYCQPPIRARAPKIKDVASRNWYLTHEETNLDIDRGCEEHSCKQLECPAHQDKLQYTGNVMKLLRCMLPQPGPLPPSRNVVTLRSVKGVTETLVRMRESY
jgi:hypothetical protein